MKIEDLKPAKGKSRRAKRVGRGIGSGHGKTSCRGHKGQKARSGGTKGPGFEGGQMPLQRRLPKRGFKRLKKLNYVIVNLRDIRKIENSGTITPEILLEKGFIKDIKNGVKILGEGDIQKPLTIKANAFSASAKAKVEASGGKCELIEKFQTIGDEK
ncbi:MAG: 50S ribosomal protein L15 [Nitrospirae bacterium]|nr:50S ribosomal protein L15 [Nitrospirota bacterium]